MLNSEIFRATLKGHGLYSPEQFVLRLSPRNHALIDRVTARDFDPANMESDMLQAFSTYLHETIHWWQHTGSTSGFILSMCYPLQLHSTLAHIQRWCELGDPTKPIVAAAIEGQQKGITHSDERQACANMILNFTADFENYRKWLLDPARAQELIQDPHFESQGHCFRIVYSDLVENFASQVDPEYKVLPNPIKWSTEFDRLARERVMGFYYGSPGYRKPIGVREIYEGQACFLQMQYLACSGIGVGELQNFREEGMLHGVYERAFTEFFKLTEIEAPLMVIDPRVALFLLVCDVAINPMEGLLCDIPNISDLINHADPGIRFLILCNVAKEYQEQLVGYIKDYSAEEYVSIAGFLSEAAGFMSPQKGWDAVTRLVQTEAPLSELMEEHRMLKYSEANVVLRVMVSHFISFNADKASAPHFFCWPGVWMAQMKEDDWISALWLKHLALFRDREEDDGIFITRRAGVTEEDANITLNAFFGNLLACDLTRQWALKDGAFNFDFRWLSEKHTPERWREMSEGVFETLYGVKIDDVVF
jgi:hypothetical protein